MELQLAHFSVQQYLQSKQIEATFRGITTEVGSVFQDGLNEIRERGSITRICLAYLSHLAEQRPVRKIRIEFPLAQYSAQYWMDHSRPAETEKDVQERILNFFLQQRQTYAAWGELFDPDLPLAEEPPQWRAMATPLYYASLAGLHNTVEVLLEKGAIVNAQGGRYGNALQAASSQAHKEIVQLLIEKGADANARTGICDDSTFNISTPLPEQPNKKSTSHAVDKPYKTLSSSR